MQFGLKVSVATWEPMVLHFIGPRRVERPAQSSEAHEIKQQLKEHRGKPGLYPETAFLKVCAKVAGIPDTGLILTGM